MSPMRRGSTVVVWLGTLGLACTAAGGSAAPWSATARATSFEIDGVQVEVKAAFLPGRMVASKPGDFLQKATASAARPFRELSLTAVPYGARAATERLPRAEPGAVATYAAELYRFRAAQGAQIDTHGTPAVMFGQRVSALVSVVPIDLYGKPQTPTLIAEWVVEAGNRLWLLRASRELPAAADLGAPETGDVLRTLEGLSLDSATLDRPSTLGRTASDAAPAFAAAEPDAITPTNGYAPWWNNTDCDDTQFYAAYGVHPYRLGATYQNMPACGPARDTVSQSFGSGGLPGTAWRVYDFQCVELSMRYLRLRQNVNPYSANGNTLVDNYAGSTSQNPNGPMLDVVLNLGAPPAPQPGDVLSYCATCSAGHTSVVSSVNVGSTGSGSITVIEENNAASGQTTLTVTNWLVSGGNAGAVSKWLVGDQDATPAAGRYSNGLMAVFARGRDNNLYYKLSNNWGGAWTSLGGGGGLRGSPAVVQYGDGHLEVYTRWSDDTLRYLSQLSPSGGWSTTWVSLSGNKIQGSPSAVLNSGGGVHVAVWQADNQLGFAWKATATGAWTNVATVGGILTANPSAIVDAANRVSVVVRNITFGGHIIRQSAPGSGTWGVWTALYGTFDTGLAVGKNSDGRLEVFGVGPDGAMNHNWETCTGGCNTWSGWSSLGGQWTRTPVVARNANGTLEVFAVKLTNSTAYDNAPYHISQLNGWGGWAWLDGQMRVGRPAIGTYADGHLEMYVRGDDRVMSRKPQSAANSLSWGAWAGIGGSWP